MNYVRENFRKELAGLEPATAMGRLMGRCADNATVRANTNPRVAIAFAAEIIGNNDIRLRGCEKEIVNITRDLAYLANEVMPYANAHEEQIADAKAFQIQMQENPESVDLADLMHWICSCWQILGEKETTFKILYYILLAIKDRMPATTEAEQAAWEEIVEVL